MPLSVQVLLMAGNKDIRSVTFPGLMLRGMLAKAALSFSSKHTDGDASQVPMELEAFDILVKDQRLSSLIRHFPKPIFA